MSSRTAKLKGDILLNSRDGLAVIGYIRKELTQNCMIDVIMERIIRFYMNNAGSLYVFGDNRCGCLGLKEYYNTGKKCRRPTLCAPFDKDNASSVAARNRHMLILDIDGSVWGCGKADNGRLATARTGDVKVPMKLPLNYRVVSICAGNSHSLCLCDNGWVQSFGENKYGQLGYSHLRNSFIPQTIETLKQYIIIQICVGSDHSTALTADGDLFCFGLNDCGQCGVGKQNGKNVKTPTKVQLDDEIEFVDCGDLHSLCITQSNLLYSFGSGYKGLLGHGNIDNKYTPTLIEALKEKRIKTCAGGGSHSLCMDVDGIIWSFGDNYWGQCGLPSNIKKQATPKMIDWFAENNIKAIDCSAGSYTSSVIAEDGSLYVFGSNGSYKLAGLKSNTKYFTPTKLVLPKKTLIKSISLGCEHTGIIM